jgi:hypothetical protein
MYKGFHVSLPTNRKRISLYRVKIIVALAFCALSAFSLKDADVTDRHLRESFEIQPAECDAEASQFPHINYSWPVLSRLLSKTLKIKICKTIILCLALYGYLSR